MGDRSLKIKISLVQLDVSPDRQDNLWRAEALVVGAAKSGSQIICLPELFSYMGSFEDPKFVAEAVNGSSITLMRRIAKRHQVYMVAGSILEQTRKGLPKNTCFVIGPDGGIAARYSKLHLFDIDIPGRIHFCETGIMKPGSHATVVRTRFGKIGLAICNDLRYPELFRRLVLAGARVIFIPSAFTKFTGRDHWIALNRVRAMENQCYVVAVNQSGKNVDGVRFFGSSVVVDPWGKVLKEGPASGDALINCTIDLGMVDEIREQLPALKKIRNSYPLKIFR